MKKDACPQIFGRMDLYVSVLKLLARDFFFKFLEIFVKHYWVVQILVKSGQK